MRTFRCREAEDEVEGEEMGLSDPEESTRATVGRVYDDGDSDSAEDSSMRLDSIKASESDESIRELRGRVETDGTSESSEWWRRWKGLTGIPSLVHPASDSEDSTRIESGRCRGRRGSGDVRADRLCSRPGERLRLISGDG